MLILLKERSIEILYTNRAIKLFISVGGKPFSAVHTRLNRCSTRGVSVVIRIVVIHISSFD